MFCVYGGPDAFGRLQLWALEPRTQLGRALVRVPAVLSERPRFRPHARGVSAVCPRARGVDVRGS